MWTRFVRVTYWDARIKLATPPIKLETSSSRALETRYFFRPVGFETYGIFGSSAASLLKDFGKRTADRTGEKRASEFLRQKISIDIQRGNAASVLATFPQSRGLDEVFYISNVKNKTS